ncbi:hypothetical protein [Streptomyces albicerus]|uniref:hypothetical protein n=1 Tax=Streptomyces albicerus TaxID=2569859 RepID=UPI00124B4C08|nr:hypothetical protein [Streptomyces albicerus]
MRRDAYDRLLKTANKLNAELGWQSDRLRGLGEPAPSLVDATMLVAELVDAETTVLLEGPANMAEAASELKGKFTDWYEFLVLHQDDSAIMRGPAMAGGRRSWAQISIWQFAEKARQALDAADGAVDEEIRATRLRGGAPGRRWSLRHRRRTTAGRP